jgi:hypothetical protein
MSSKTATSSSSASTFLSDTAAAEAGRLWLTSAHPACVGDATTINPRSRSKDTILLKTSPEINECEQRKRAEASHD